VTTPPNIDAAALAQARERLEDELQRFKDCYRFGPEAADVRLVLDALTEADSLKRHVLDIIRTAPTAADFESGGKYDYDCENIGDMENKAVASERLAIAEGLRAALAAKEQA
jgi:hypothetical protein